MSEDLKERLIECARIKREKIWHNEVKVEQLQDLQTNCHQCFLKKDGTCPYIEEIVDCHLFNNLESQEVAYTFRKEKRQYPRITTSISAFISGVGSGEEKLRIGSIKNISLGGLLISIPRGMQHKVFADPQMAEFEIITTLPDKNKPIRFKCKPQRVVHYRDNIHVGASIIH
ncbi:MAG: PilZ domain-containing protein [Bacteroidota bacterium]|nr:PilZ domain-containing protein [Bacteroidota bacterium]